MTKKILHRQTGFAVRHIPTGFYLPVPRGRLGRGGSHVEPCDPADIEPRLFINIGNAKGYLTTWLKGKFIANRGMDGFSGEYYDDLDIYPEPSRKREEMEIVKVEFIFKESEI